jgi:hypothetical protein
MRREQLDTPEDLPKEALRQVAFGQLEDEVRSMPDQAAAGLERPLLRARQRPILKPRLADGSSEIRARWVLCILGPAAPATSPG